MSKIRRKIFLKSGKVFVYRVFGVFINFIFQILLSRYAGDKVFGEYSYVLSIVNILSVISLLGLDHSVIQSFPRIESLKIKKNYLYFGTLIAFVLSAFSITIFGLCFELKSIFFGLLVYLILFTCNKYFDSILCGERKTEISVFYNIVIRNSSRLVIFLGFSLISSEISIFHLYMIIVVPELLGIFLRFKKLKYIVAERSEGSIINVIQNIKETGIFFYVIGIINILTLNVDKLLIPYFMEFSQLAHYKAAESFAVLLTLFISPFQVFWPYISRLFNEDKIDVIDDIYKKIVFFVALAVIPTLVVLINSREFLLSLFGSDYIGTSSVLIILAVTYGFDAMMGPANAVLKMTKYVKQSSVINIVSFTMNIILIIGLRYRGIIGFAQAKLISLMIINIVNVFLLWRLLNVWPFTLKHLFLVVVGVFVFLLFNRFQLPVQNKILLFITTAALSFITYIGIVGLVFKKEFYAAYKVLKSRIN